MNTRMIAISSRRSLRSFAARALFFALAVAATPAAHAATALLPNGGFESGAAGWTAGPGLQASVGASSLDEAGKAEAGSLAIYNIQSGVWQGMVHGPCIAMDDNQPIAFGGSVWGGDVAVPPTLTAVIQFYSDASCANAMPGATWADLAAIFETGWIPVQGYTRSPAGAQSARLSFSLAVGAATDLPAAAHVDNAFVVQGVSCVAGSKTACLGGGRFRVDTRWRVPEGTRGFGNLRAFSASGGAPDSAWATFFGASNVELVVKVLDGCEINDQHWVFAAGLTNVFVAVRVHDTWTGEVWTHQNPLNTAFAPVQDTDAFATCEPLMAYGD
jgi:hypothetical protein